eukprot:scaffold92653_cov55-Phaeocystis_antarctica.AAC.2
MGGLDMLEAFSMRKPRAGIICTRPCPEAGSLGTQCGALRARSGEWGGAEDPIIRKIYRCAATRWRRFHCKGRGAPRKHENSMTSWLLLSRVCSLPGQSLRVPTAAEDLVPTRRPSHVSKDVTSYAH